jgi:hypothetical protein
LKVEWTDVSENTRDWLKLLGNFVPTVHAKQRELKGYLGEEGRTYFDAGDLRNIAAALIEAADWLDKRAEAEAPAVGAA